MKRDIYWFGVRGEQYGIWNAVQKCWQFGICEDTPMLAEARLVQKIGDGARKWRFEVRPLPKEMRKAAAPENATLIELQRQDRKLKQLKKKLRETEAKWNAQTDPGKYEKLIEDLRSYASQYRSGETHGRAIEATESIMDEAAGAVDTLARELDWKDKCIELAQRKQREAEEEARAVLHGHWVKPVPGDGENCCSVCKAPQPWFYGHGYLDSPHCPYCGAKMDGGDE